MNAAKKKQPELPAELVRAMGRLDEEGLALLLGDLLTPAEIEALGERWQITRLLLEGKSQRDVASELGVSITTVSRGSRQLKYGQGGFERAIEALGRKK